MTWQADDAGGLADPGPARSGDGEGGTDAARLRAAFGELSRRGIGADWDLGPTMCCGSCGHAEAERGPQGYVFTHRQTYGPAFWGGPRQPLPALLEEEVAQARTWLGDYVSGGPGDPAEELFGEWLRRGDNERRLNGAYGYEREHRWHTLVAPLLLYWRAESGPGELVEVLRAHGLDVVPPADDRTAVQILPSGRPRPPARPWPGDARARTLARDREDAVSPVLRGLCDDWPPHSEPLPEQSLYGTAEPAEDERRAWRLLDWLARRALPACLRTLVEALPDDDDDADDDADADAYEDADDAVTGTAAEAWESLSELTHESMLDSLDRPGLPPSIRLLTAIFLDSPDDETVEECRRHSGLAAAWQAIEHAPGMSYRAKSFAGGLDHHAAEALAHVPADARDEAAGKLARELATLARLLVRPGEAVGP
ncbi:hypothetical protein [Actinomadura sp. HBU206391]|uniref:hypothetical protein n=1 Tax=Actinomadura sp. HBU206391 TaxID=2731692 RepID=UPI00164F7F5D|nr:hypothetical protein [Actinomadura sp. HBU206391]MBC6460648.1 hypothetical protein [Actinomadura sp. HBU206391]